MTHVPVTKGRALEWLSASAQNSLLCRRVLTLDTARHSYAMLSRRTAQARAVHLPCSSAPMHGLERARSGGLALAREPYDSGQSRLEAVFIVCGTPVVSNSPCCAYPPGCYTPAIYRSCVP